MSNFEHLCGWSENEYLTEKIMARSLVPKASMGMNDIKESGKGKQMMLHKFVEKLSGKPYYVRTQEIGDCTSFAQAGFCDIIMSIQSILKNTSGSWGGYAATEPIYGFGRVEIGNRMFGRGDGCNGASVMEGVQKYGILSKKKYNNIDLTNYSGQRAKDWGWSGVPDELEPIAKEHPIQTISRVESWEEARDLLYNGYAVTLCSNQGFSGTRGKYGISRPQGSWSHALLLIGYDDTLPNPIGCIMNSWGVWNTGEKWLDQPDGSFFADAQVIDRMIKAGDSWTGSGFIDYAPQKLDLDWF